MVDTKSAGSFQVPTIRRVFAPLPSPLTGTEAAQVFKSWCGNDPSAGSPTETLLRLHLPLNGKV